MSDHTENTNESNEPDFENEAREMGWVDKDSFQGDEEKWVDAKTFVERGEHIMPLLRANNKRLKQDLLTRDKEIDSLKTSVESANRAIKALQKHYTEATKQQIEQATKDLREQLKQAKETGDVDAEIDIQDKLHEIRQTSKEVKEENDGVVEDKKPTETLNPDFIAWNKENPWFGDDKNVDNRKRTKALVRIGEDLRDDGDTTVGRAFMDKCLSILEKQESASGKRVANKVEGSSNGTRSGGGRAFDRLPKEAKDACHEQSEDFVGPGKMFKVVKEWEDHFASYYNED